MLAAAKRPEVMTMRCYLVVANQTLGGDRLHEIVRERIAAGSCRFHVLVPATPVAELERPPADDASDEQHRDARVAARHALEDEMDEPTVTAVAEDSGRALARERLARELAWLRALGATASGEVGVSDPVEAVRLVMHRDKIDEIILSTLPSGRSRWLAKDLPTRVRRASGLPVVHVQGQPGPGPEPGN
jgi:hypothetical protein